MKVRIFDEAVMIPEKEIILRLFRQRRSGSIKEEEIVVGIVDEEGNKVHRGQLVAFAPDMRLMRRSSINEKLGLPLDYQGKLKIEEAD